MAFIVKAYVPDSDKKEQKWNGITALIHLLSVDQDSRHCNLDGTFDSTTQRI